MAGGIEVKTPEQVRVMRRAGLVVACRVGGPRIGLATEDLIRAHVQAGWLSASGLRRGASMREVLDLANVDERTPVLLDGIVDRLRDADARIAARSRAACTR